MSQAMIERACERLQKQLSPDERLTIQNSTSIDHVRHAIGRIEQHLAARQSLRNLGRLSPFLDAIDRLTKPIDILCNGTPFMPYAWAPLKLILLAAQHHVRALDKLLSAYERIGLALPRLARYGETFPDNYQFQHLLTFLYSDIIEFHTRALRLIQKPGWKTFFSSGWGRFEHQFDALLQSITQTTELIDKETVSLDISLAQESRQRFSENAEKLEKRMEFEQREAVLRWLEVGDSKSYQEDKLELLRSHCCEGTSQWLTKTQQVRSWLQFVQGNSVMWLHGKPGSAQVLRSLCVQMIDLAPELTSFIYDECVISRSSPSVLCLKTIIPKLMTAFRDVRIIIDGIDEVSYSQHRELIQTLSSLAEMQDNCKILFSSQNIPSIFSSLKGKPQFPLGAQSLSIAKDIDLIIVASLQELSERHDGSIPESVLTSIRKRIQERAEGMFLWVYLVLEILKGEVSIEGLQASIESLPEDLAGAYNKILTNITRSSSANSISKQRRVFGWMLFAKSNQPLRKHELRLALTLHSECCSVTRESKPFPNALDICHPFIEDGPRGSVVFIHSTVPKFLLDRVYGPFVDKIESYRDISVACLGQLSQGLYLAPQQSDPTQIHLQISQGFHALLPYAVEYWTEHLFDYLEIDSVIDSRQRSQVLTQLLKLSNEHSRISKASTQGSVQHISEDKRSEEDQRLKCLQNFPGALDLVKSSMNLRQVIDIATESPGLSPDPTLFWSIRREYHKAVLYLMAQESCTGLTLEELMVFKEEFGPTAFVCDVRGCERSLVGYSNANALKDHEARHRGQLKCVESRCLYNDIGFSSLKQLRNHKRKRHPSPVEADIPQKIQRKESPRSRQQNEVTQLSPHLQQQMHQQMEMHQRMKMQQQHQQQQQKVMMDAMELPPQILNQLQAQLPPDIKKWVQLKIWLQQNNIPSQLVAQLVAVQEKQFSLLFQRRAQLLQQAQQPR
ncbi:NACHT domain-containing protein [Fusarium austroafricanum]|uniref:NACHT domain-containing protein n=1 Tax=Fusarium austroafricanum TaxID=2364996 RepID=A0A8H4K704_9HYPO|nr:NACHT domain-containing protein [Fusarium austroafricanum]